VADHDALVAGLRKWAAAQDGHVRAAVDVLVDHEYWLRHEVFTSAWMGVVRYDEDATWIAWDTARGFCESGQVRGASVSQVSVLRFAVALGLDLYRLNFASDGDAEAAVRAVATATGLEKMLRA
jgi:hypothetical protein